MTHTAAPPPTPITPASGPRLAAERVARLVHVARHAQPWVALVAFVLGMYAVAHALHEFRFVELRAELRAVSAGRLLAALLTTALGYGALATYDALALCYAGVHLRLRQVVPAAFISWAFSNSVGLAMLTGTSLRLRLYGALGVGGDAIARVVVFTAITMWLGILALGGVALVVEPASLTSRLGLPPAGVNALGATLLLVVFAYVAWCTRRRPHVRVGSVRIRPPAASLALGQLAASALDWGAAALTLYLLLPPGARPGFAIFAGAFLLAQSAGLVSHVPGGLGVFEGTLLLLLGGAVPPVALAGALVLFRATYYLLPLLSATVLLGLSEAARQRAWVQAVAGRWGPLLAPPLLALGTAAAGTVLLLSGATPALSARLASLRTIVPLPVVEGAHFVGSVAGVALLLVARGLWRRIDAAWLFAALLLVVGAVASLAKGIDVEEALVLLAVLAALLPARRLFYRRGRVLTGGMSWGWFAAVAMVVGASIWLGLFAYHHVEYSHDLWWRFEFRGDAPRFLRASAGAALFLFTVGLWRLLGPAPPRGHATPALDLERARAVLCTASDPSGALALLGDKTLLFSPSGRSFVMYAVSGRSWVAMGDPVGDPQEFPALVWQFRERVDRFNGWPVFYEVHPHHLPLYLDLGLAVRKLGEMAEVPLQTFALEGGSRAPLRQALNQVGRTDARFDVIPAEAVAPLLSELRRVSDDWLRNKEAREKGFSLGVFDEAYLRRFPVAVVRREAAIVAFSNLWPAGDRSAISVDLMRFSADAPKNVMLYLFVQVMLWSREQGYGRFDLGMAPLSGMADRSLAPLSSRLGALLYRHGENFYNFKGVRAFKEKFHPEWTPRYLVTPGGFRLPLILTDLASLVSGGVRGILFK